MPPKINKKTTIPDSVPDVSEIKEEKIKQTPIVYEINNDKDDIFEHKADPVYSSSSIDYPKLEYGLQHFIHQSREATYTFKEFEGRKKVYLVMNPYEHKVDEYEDDIESAAKEYFDKKAPEILSRAFYKLWEILMMYDLIDNNKENFVSAHLAEGPGSFIQATMYYREMGSKWKNDKYYAVTLHPEDGKGHIPPLESKFIEHYEKEKPQRFFLHKTYTKQIAGGIETKDNGDLTNPKTIKLFGGEMKSKADLVTADGGFEWNNETLQEQEAFRLIFAQIVSALKVQKKGGNFVCKVFETYTKTSVKFIKILSEFYKDVHICKPFTSRPTNSEKYLVCQGFKYEESDKFYKDAMKELDLILESNHKMADKNLINIFPEYNPSKEYLRNIIKSNINISNVQFKYLNEALLFIESKNYYGDEYQMRRQIQINSTKNWNKTFYSKEKSKKLLEAALIK